MGDRGQPPGARDTDPAGLPAHGTAYEQGDVTALEQAAAALEVPALPSGEAPRASFLVPARAVRFPLPPY